MTVTEPARYVGTARLRTGRPERHVLGREGRMRTVENRVEFQVEK